MFEVEIRFLNNNLSQIKKLLKAILLKKKQQKPQKVTPVCLVEAIMKENGDSHNSAPHVNC